MQEPIQTLLEDKGRMAELARLDVHHSRGDAVLQCLVQQAAEEFDLPISLVSIVLDRAQMFAASCGLQGWLAQVQGTPIEWSFCVHSIPTQEPFVVEYAPVHPTVEDNPLVYRDGVRSYAGVPMVTENGQVIGNFCVLGTEPRSFTQDEMDRLCEYARRAIARLEERVEKEAKR